MSVVLDSYNRDAFMWESRSHLTWRSYLRHIVSGIDPDYVLKCFGLRAFASWNAFMLFSIAVLRMLCVHESSDLWCVGSLLFSGRLECFMFLVWRLINFGL